MLTVLMSQAADKVLWLLIFCEQLA